MISVLIATKNRPIKLKACLESILKSIYKNFEIIVIDQSTSPDTKKIVGKINSKKIKYFEQDKRGKAKAINWGLEKCQSDIIALTDDDCVVKNNWLEKINKAFDKYKDIAGVYGRVLPHSPEDNLGKTCVCIFKSNKQIISELVKHWKQVGFGNNCAYKKEVLLKIGLYRSWLGPGSIGLAGVDAELIIKTFVSGYKLLHDPKIVVYHDHWLKGKELRKMKNIYDCGETASYGFWAFKGKAFCRQIVLDDFSDSYWKIRTGLKKIITFKKHGFIFLWRSLKQLLYRLWGLLLGWYFSKKESE
jgi:glycosyltransferase involved in cell wall biosynthesis